VYSLGFITKLHGLYLYYNRYKDILNYYREVLQPFNNEIFDRAIIFILLSLALLILEINKKAMGILGLVLSIVTTVYSYIYSFKYIKLLKDLKDQYLLFDLTKSKKYTSSTITFDIGHSLYFTFAIVSILLSIIVIINFLVKIKNRGAKENE
jgi:uncharacterized membrane protein